MNLDRLVQEIRHGALAVGVLAAIVAPGSLDAQMTGTITGVVSTNVAASAKPIRVTMDQRVCGDELPDEAIVAGGNGALANAIVRIAGVKIRSATGAQGILNEKCRFTPRVQIVRPNATITTTSSDPVLHTTNAQTATGRTIFNVALPIAGVKINRSVSGAGLLRLSCNTHPWMRGWVLVTDEAAAVTGADGRFTLSEVPAGTYEVAVWHESLKGVPQKVTVTAGQTATIDFALK
jgi:hypothetical protein